MQLPANHPDPSNAYRGRVLADWVDYNGHLNDAYYNVALSRAIDHWMDNIGLDAEARATHQVSMFTLQTMVHYQQEMHLDDPFVVYPRLVDYDHNKAHLHLSLCHAETGETHAVMEALLLHMDMAAHRPAPYLSQTEQQLAAMFERHQQWPRPQTLGATIGIRRKS